MGGTEKGGHLAALLFGLVVAVAMLGAAISLAVALVPATALAEEAVPWGAGCTSAPPSAPRTAESCGATLEGGEASPPPGAPPPVRRVIAAADEIDHRPYVWGGGHTSWLSHGYDCSGAVGYALHGAGLLDVTMVSGQLASWGLGGAGRWITVYANAEHVFMVITGLRFDTRSDPLGVSGPRWHQATRVDTRKFVARHPAGL
jgi:hypothetical protein